MKEKNLIASYAERAAAAARKRELILKTLRGEIWCEQAWLSAMTCIQPSHLPRVLSRLLDEGLVRVYDLHLGGIIVREKKRRGGEAEDVRRGGVRWRLVGITAAGQAKCAEEFGMARIERSCGIAAPSPMTAKHKLQLQALRLQAKHEGAQGLWISEQVLRVASAENFATLQASKRIAERKHEQAAQDALDAKETPKPAALRKETEGEKVPDAIWLDATTKQRWAIELELHAKSQSLWIQALNKHLRAMQAGEWSRVLYVFPTRAGAEAARERAKDDLVRMYDSKRDDYWTLGKPDVAERFVWLGVDDLALYLAGKPLKLSAKQQAERRSREKAALDDYNANRRLRGLPPLQMHAYKALPAHERY